MEPISEDIEIVTILARDEVIVVPKQVAMGIPYFEPLLSGRWSYDEYLPIDVEPSLMKLFVFYANNSYKESSVLLTKLSRKKRASDVVELSNYLCHNLPVVTNLQELKMLEERLKDVKQQELEKVARGCYEPGHAPDRFGAREAGAQLAFSLVLNTLDLHNSQIRNKVVNDVLFIVSHAKTFGPRLRTHIWRVFNEKISTTPKQMKQFDNWISEERLSFDCNRDSDASGSETDGNCSTGCISSDNDHNEYYGYYD